MAIQNKNAVRLNISLPSELVESVDKVCKEIGCARSVYIAIALRSKLNSDAMMEKMPEMVSMMHEMMSMATLMDERKSADGSDGSGCGGA